MVYLPGRFVLKIFMFLVIESFFSGKESYLQCVSVQLPSSEDQLCPAFCPGGCDYGVLFDDNLNVYVEAEERLLVTHAVEQEGATADNFISRSRQIKIVRWATCRLSNGSVGSWSTFTQCIFMSI